MSSATVAAPTTSAAVPVTLSSWDQAFAHSSAATTPTQQPLVNSSAVNFLETASPNIMPAPEPSVPFMIDPSLNFDCGEWDNIFAQSLPVADELMELDQVTGLAFVDLEMAFCETSIKWRQINILLGLVAQAPPFLFFFSPLHVGCWSHPLPLPVLL